MWPAHRFEDLGVYVLEWDIEIVEDFVARSNRFNQAVADSTGIKIEEANPFEAWDFCEFEQQVWQGIFGWEVAAIGGYILSDYVQFDSAGGDKLLGFGEDE